MFDRISNSWRLVKASFAVLQSDKELIVFPIVSGIAMLAVSVVFFVPLAAAGLLDNLSNPDGGAVLTYIVLFLFYVVAYSVIFFANTALVGAALIRLRGGDPTLADGFRIASERAGKILGYALIAATVGMVLRAVSERAGIIGRIVISVIGFAWSVATFLTVPVLVSEDVGPIEAVKRSSELLKKTWGEQLVGNFGLGTVFGLLMFGIVFLVGVPLFTIGASMDSPAFIVLTMIVLIVLVIALGVLNSTLSGIYQAALYRYAVDGDAGEFFDPELIQGAFKPKRKRGLSL